MKRILIIAPLALVLAGCAVGPDYHRPAPLPAQPTPQAFSTGGTNAVLWKVAEPSANVPRGDWWQMFNDAELGRLETLALTNNQNLAAAAARFEEARQLVAVARSGILSADHRWRHAQRRCHAAAHERQPAAFRPGLGRGAYL